MCVCVDVTFTKGIVHSRKRLFVEKDVSMRLQDSCMWRGGGGGGGASPFVRVQGVYYGERSVLVTSWVGLLSTTVCDRERCGVPLRLMSFPQLRATTTACCTHLITKDVLID